MSGRTRTKTDTRSGDRDDDVYDHFGDCGDEYDDLLIMLD